MEYKNKFYLVITLETPEGKYYDYMLPVTECTEIKSAVERWSGKDSKICNVNIIKTKKRAVELVEAWRESHRANGTYAFN